MMVIKHNSIITYSIDYNKTNDEYYFKYTIRLRYNLFNFFVVKDTIDLEYFDFKTAKKIAFELASELNKKFN